MGCSQTKPEVSNPTTSSGGAAKVADGKSFTFVLASYLRAGDINLNMSLQHLRQEHPETLVTRFLTLKGAVLGEYARDILAVSHRWENPAKPDVLGKQAEALRSHLEAQPEIMFVWYDYTCMPQGKRSAEDEVLFSETLAHVNILYLGARCCLLVDLSYLSRFW